MKISFMVNQVYISPPLGVMLLSAILKSYGHETDLISLRQHDVISRLDAFKPDIIGYSVMSTDLPIWEKIDDAVKSWIGLQSVDKIYRIMGGPHPTFFPKVLDKMALDAICVGEGDNSLPMAIDRIQNGRDLDGIPNLIPSGGSIDKMEKELIHDLDALPFPDYDIYFQAEPFLKNITLASILTSRGCPYLCSYCFNKAYNKLFAGCGLIVRKRSVDNVFAEIQYLRDKWPKLNFLRFADDTFIHKLGPWEEEFFARYKDEIGLPFYCLMRSNTLSNEVAAKLKDAGCVSMSMALESGSEDIRNRILKRNISDDLVRSSFAIAKKYGIRTLGNAMFALPGSTIEDDFKSIRMMKEIGMTAPTFGFFSPFPGTELTNYGIEIGIFDAEKVAASHYLELPKRKIPFTEEEEYYYENIRSLASIFCELPKAFFPLLKPMAKIKFSKKFYSLISYALHLFKMRLIFPTIYPKNPYIIFKFLFKTITFLIPKTRIKQVKNIRT